MKTWVAQVGSLVLIAVGGIGCFGSNQETTFSDQSPFIDDPSKPFSEVYIEYPGPHEKWAGPQTFSIHLDAKGARRAHVQLSTSIFRSEFHLKKDLQSLSQNLTIEAAREEIARLSNSLKTEESPVSGCLLPVRVRMIRSDGVTVTRQGCRGQNGWPKVASEISNHWITSSMVSGAHSSN
jgi:hypothetical protein